MLKGYLYDAALAGDGKYVLTLSEDCPVFEGHFPGFPVLPGAAIIEIVRELVSESLGRQVFFPCMRSVKFMKMIAPSDRPHVGIAIDPEVRMLRAVLSVGDEEYVKINASFAPAP